MPFSIMAESPKNLVLSEWLCGTDAHLAVRGIVRGFGGFRQRTVDAPRSGLRMTVLADFRVIWSNVP